MRKNKNIPPKHSHLEWIGLGLIDVSLLLAFTIQYKHYYELLVLGFFLVLYQLDKRFLLFPQYIRLYVILFKAGIIGDLILGIGLGLWHYNFAHLYEYVALYGVEYPLAGLVMVQSYIFATQTLKLTGKIRNPLPITFYKQSPVFFGVTALAAAFLTLQQIAYEISILVFYSAISLCALALLSYISRVRGHDTLFEEIHNNPLKMLLTLLAIIYFYAFIQEISNSYVHQWTYSDFALAHATFMDVPLAVFGFWPLLVLLPVGAYYYVVPIRLPRIKSHRNTTVRPKNIFIAHLPRHAHVR
jgi:hypothetical protein